jgi:hypothetical protein
VTVISAIPLLQSAGATYLAIAATGLIYLSYFLVGTAILRARLKGWPHRTRRSSSASGGSRCRFSGSRGADSGAVALL